MSDKKQPTIVWQCHRCNHVNADNRKSYVICVGCGQAYDKAPKDGGDLHQEWANRAAMIVRGTQDSSSGMNCLDLRVAQYWHHKDGSVMLEWERVAALEIALPDASEDAG